MTAVRKHRCILGTFLFILISYREVLAQECKAKAGVCSCSNTIVGRPITNSEICMKDANTHSGIELDFSNKNNEWEKLKMNSFNSAGFNVTAIKNLKLSNCSVRKIEPGTFQNFVGLKFLDLSNNNFHELNLEVFSGFLNIIAIYLQNNSDLTQLRGQFPEYSSLRRIDLSYCRLSTLTVHTFDGVKHLTTLNLEGNQFKSLHPNVFPIWDSSVQFHFKDNPWHCDCNLNQLVTYLAKKKQLEFISCKTPVEKAIEDEQYACVPAVQQLEIGSDNYTDIDPVNLRVHIGDTLAIKCVVNTLANISWQLNDRHLQSGESNVHIGTEKADETIKSSLTIHQMTDQNVGLYTCEAKNDAGEDEKSLRINIVGSALPAPGIIADDGDEKVHSSQLPKWIWILVSFIVIAILVIIVFLSVWGYRKKANATKTTLRVNYKVIFKLNG